MKSQVYVCDECGAQKRSANHWWLIAASHDGVELALGRWDEEIAAEEGQKHYCGRDCALQAISKFMELATSQQPAARS